MVDNKEENSDGGFAQIKPVAIDLSGKASTESSVKTGKYPKKTIFLGVGFGILLTAAAVVIFLLPRWIDPPAVDPVQVSTPVTKPDTSSRTTKTSTESPWEKAQQSKLRKETQQILAQMLDAQKTLEGNGVYVWADKEYTQAIQHAQTGDAFYNQREFTQARVEYQQALDIMTKLMDEVDDVFKELMETGEKALAEENSETAIAAFDVALAIDPIDRAANIGRERAGKLDEVVSLIEQGDDLLNESGFEEAKMKYAEALALDNNSERAKKQIQLADRKILDREFNLKMSAGFTALEQKKYTRARQSFAEARKLKPKSVEARSAYTQTQHTITTLNINALLAQGRKLETGERWHDALAKYESALKLDNTLAEALQGKDRTTIRTKIHDKLEQILKNPQRLYDREVYDETVSFHGKIQAVSDPGPVLSKQLADLKTLLDKSVTPVAIRLQSDNLTRVTLYRIGELGYFTSKDLTVRPGRYVAVGHREGYRDARVEFLVEPDKPLPVISIQAQEKIALGK